jgi:hypothetical protein
MSSTTTATGGTMGDGTSDIVIDKLDRHEPLLPGRRVQPQPSSAATNNVNKISREKSNYGSDEQVLLRANTGGSSSITAGLTQEALNELVPQSRIASKKLFHDIVLRKPSGVGSHGESIEEPNGSRRVVNSSSLAPIKSSLTTQRGNVLIVQQTQQQKVKPRSLPSSTLDHANQNDFNVSHDPYGGRVSRNPSRISHIDHPKKMQQNSPVRYNPGKLKNSFFYFIVHFIIPIQHLFPHIFFVY